MASMIELDNTEWALVEDLFDPLGREGAPARYPRRQIVDAILFLARTGCQLRYLPACYPPWEAVWQQWRRWRSNGVWAAAMTRIASLIRTRKGRAAKPSMVMIDVQVESARPHHVSAGRRLLDAALPGLGPVKAIVADRGYRGLAKMAAKREITLDIKAPPKGTVGFTPIAPLYRVEHAFARLGRWRRLSRCYEGTSESARAWLEVAALAYLFARLRVEPA
jgi:putative transposase